MPRYRDVEAALDAWRAAERRIAELDQGTPEWVAAEAEVERLRREYHSLMNEAGELSGDPEPVEVATII